MKVSRRILKFLQHYVMALISLAARNEGVRNLLSRGLRFIVRCIPQNAKEYAELKYASDIASVLHESLAGAAIYRSHSFAKVLGNTKTVSFIFPYYQKKEEIVNAIATLKNQKYSVLNAGDIEIIVIDDGSKELLDDVLDDDVIYLRRNKFRYGISRCRNLGAKISSGRILCFVDPDFVFPEDYVETLFEEFKKYGKSAVITGYIHDYFYKGAEDPRVAFGAWETPDRPTRRFLQLAGGHMAIDRTLFFNSGGFDEDLIYGGVEDIYFGYQLSKNPDLSIVFSSKVRVHHIPHPVGLAHAEPQLSYRVAAFKAPDFYKVYIVDGAR